VVGGRRHGSGDHLSLREENIALVERFHNALLDSRDVDAIHEFVADDFASHNTPPGLPEGIAGARGFFEMLHVAFPDAHVEIEQLVADEEWVAVATRLSGTHSGPLMGLDPTGRRVSVTMVDLVRIAGGKIVEHRGLTDTVGMLRQLNE
jgi:predicted ester cyclase